MLNVVLRSTVVLCMILLLIEQTQGFRTFPTSRLVGNNMGVIGRRQVLQMSTEGGVAATSPKHALFLGNLSFDVDESKLTNVVQERLSNTPGFTNVKLVKDKETGKSRGFAYVNFESEEGLPSALQALQDLEIDGTRCKVDIAGTRDRRQPMTKRNENGEGRGSRGNSFGRAIEDPEAKAKRELEARERTLYVGNLGQDMTDGLLKDIISMQLGDDMQCLKRIKVLMDKETGKYLNIALTSFLVSFPSPASLLYLLSCLPVVLTESPVLFLM